MRLLHIETLSIHLASAHDHPISATRSPEDDGALQYWSVQTVDLALP